VSAFPKKSISIISVCFFVSILIRDVVAHYTSVRNNHYYNIHNRSAPSSIKRRFVHHFKLQQLHHHYHHLHPSRPKLLLLLSNLQRHHLLLKLQNQNGLNTLKYTDGTLNKNKNHIFLHILWILMTVDLWSLMH